MTNSDICTVCLEFLGKPTIEEVDAAFDKVEEIIEIALVARRKMDMSEYSACGLEAYSWMRRAKGSLRLLVTEETPYRDRKDRGRTLVQRLIEDVFTLPPGWDNA